MRGRDGLLATSAIMRAPRLPGRALAPTSATLRASSIAVTAGLRELFGLRRGGHLRRAGRRVARRSAIAARAACMPGMPQTPPPAWVAELA